MHVQNFLIKLNNAYKGIDAVLEKFFNISIYKILLLN